MTSFSSVGNCPFTRNQYYTIGANNPYNVSTTWNPMGNSTQAPHIKPQVPITDSSRLLPPHQPEVRNTPIGANTPVVGNTPAPITDPSHMLPPHQPAGNTPAQGRVRLPEGFSGVRRQPMFNYGNVPLGGNTSAPITDPSHMLPPHQPAGGNTPHYVDNGFRFYEHPGMNQGQFSGNAPAQGRVRLPEGFSGVRRQPKFNGGNTPAGGNTPIGENISTATHNKPSRQERLREIRNNPEKRARYNRFKLKHNPELKARYDRFCKFKKDQGVMSKLKKVGKWGALAAAAIGLGALLLNKCSGNDKPVAVPPGGELNQPETPDEGITPVVTPPETPEEPEVPVTPPVEPSTDPVSGFPLDQDGQYTVKKGDCIWNIAEAYLASKASEGKSPDYGEIRAEVDRIMALNPNLKWLPKDDIEKWFVPIYPDQKIRIEKKQN